MRGPPGVTKPAQSKSATRCPPVGDRQGQREGRGHAGVRCGPVQTPLPCWALRAAPWGYWGEAAGPRDVGCPSCSAAVQNGTVQHVTSCLRLGLSQEHRQSLFFMYAILTGPTHVSLSRQESVAQPQFQTCQQQAPDPSSVASRPWGPAAVTPTPWPAVGATEHFG